MLHNILDSNYSLKILKKYETPILIPIQSLFFWTKLQKLKILIYLLKNWLIFSVHEPAGSMKYQPVQPVQSGSLAFLIKYLPNRFSVKFPVEPAGPVLITMLGLISP